MSSGYAIEYLTEYPLCWKDLDGVPDDQKAALAVVSYAASEINCLQRMYIFADHGLTGKEAVDSIILIQKQILLRNWSAKLFEFTEFLRFGNKNKKDTEDALLLKLADDCVKEFHKLCDKEGYEIARNIRHEATNHYTLSAAKSNLQYVPDRANCTMYLHEMRGNSYFPMGEEVMFVGRMNRHASRFSDEIKRRETYDKWFDWNVDATSWLHTVHTRFAKDIVFDRYQDRFASEKHYFLEPELVSEVGTRKTPVFFRKEEA